MFRPALHSLRPTQVRQHVPHKRTFLYLEQLILRAGADAQCINMKDNHEGLDFFFANRAHGLKIIDFLQVGLQFFGVWGCGSMVLHSLFALAVARDLNVGFLRCCWDLLDLSSMAALCFV